MTCIRVRILIYALFSIFVLGSLSAQDYVHFDAKKNEILSKARWRLGIFRLLPKLAFREVGYDDNVYYQRESDDPVSDFRTTIAPEINVHLLFKNYFILSLKESPEYNYFRTQERERRWGNTVVPEFKMLLFHRFVLGGSYSYSNRRFRATSEFDFRNNVRNETYKGQLFYETPRKTSIGITYETSQITYEDIAVPDLEIPLSRALDHKEYRFHGEIYYQIFNQTFLFLKAGYSDYVFFHSQSNWRDSFSYQASLGIRFPEIGRLKGQAEFGLTKLTPRDKSKQENVGWSGNTGLEYRIGRFNWKLGIRRNINFSFWTSNVYFLTLQTEAGFSFYVVPALLRFDYGFSRTNSRYPEAFPVLNPDGSVEEIIRRDKHSLHTFGLMFRVYRTTGLGIQARHWSWKSNHYLFDRDGWFIGANVTLEF